MAGNTATIDIATFRADWDANVTIGALCVKYRITKDQVIRLRSVWQLTPRHDRSTRAKPKRHRDPTPDQIRQRCLEVQSWWDDRTRQARCCIKAAPYQLPRVNVREAGLPDDYIADLERIGDADCP